MGKKAYIKIHLNLICQSLGEEKGLLFLQISVQGTDCLLQGTIFLPCVYFNLSIWSFPPFAFWGTKLAIATVAHTTRLTQHKHTHIYTHQRQQSSRSEKLQQGSHRVSQLPKQAVTSHFSLLPFLLHKNVTNMPLLTIIGPRAKNSN